MRRSVKLAALVGGGVAATAAGFSLDPRRPGPPPSLGPPNLVDLPDDVPALLRHHLDPEGRSRVPDVTSLAILGRAVMRRGGQGPGIPLRFRTSHLVGSEFVADIAVTWFGMPVLQVTDGFVSGQGISRIGGTVETGPEVDQAASLFLWSEAICVPGVWARRPGPSAEHLDERRLRLRLPRPGGYEVAELTFREGVPVRFAGDRHKGADIGLVPWSVDYLGWQRVSGIPIPRAVEVRWWDEPAPWFRVDIIAAVPNADVTEALSAARQRLTS